MSHISLQYRQFTHNHGNKVNYLITLSLGLFVNFLFEKKVNNQNFNKKCRLPCIDINTDHCKIILKQERKD